MDEQIKERLTRRSVWVRALFMVLFAIAYSVAELLVWVVAIVQFFIVLFSGRANERLLQFGNNLSAYAWQVLRFVTFNTETQPFPFTEWPDEQVGENPWTVDPVATDTSVAEQDGGETSDDPKAGG